MNNSSERSEKSSAPRGVAKVSKQPLGLAMGLKEFVGLLLSLSAFVAALFYFTGHAFMISAFQEMNIPYHLFRFTLWEYGEVGWRYVALYLFKTVVYGLISATIIGFIVLVVDYLRKRVVKRLSRSSKFSSLAKSSWPLSDLALSTMRRIIGFIQLATWTIVGFVIIASIIWAAAQAATVGGRQAGRDSLLNAQYLTLISSHPLAIPGGTQREISANEILYQYDDLYLLTYNDGRYFAYRALGTEICRPDEVYVVEASQIRQAILGMRPANAPTCP